MATPQQIDQLSDCMERLLLRFGEQQRANALLNAQIQQLTQERDSLQSRLRAARERVNALLERIPPAPAEPEAGA